MNASRMHSVLLVADDRTVARLISFCLERERFEVRHAADGEQALAAFAGTQPSDLVILDVMLPYHNGYELLASMRLRPAWANVPAIMLTGTDRQADVEKAAAAGAAYLCKPFQPEEVVARIRHMLAAAEKSAL